MPKNRKIKYYLLCGKFGEGNALDLEVDGKKKRDFDDISTLDLKTIDIPFKSAPEILKELNPDIDLSGTFYDAQYPYRKVETKTFAPVFMVEGKETRYYLDHLKYFAEQRDRKVQRGEKVSLDKNSILELYINTLLYNILKYNKRSIIRQDSFVPVDIKEDLEKGFKQMSFKSPESFINGRDARRLKMILDHYTSIRNLTLEYLATISDIKLPSRREINNFSKYENYGMEPRESVIIQKEKKSDKQIKYYQMTLNDFMNKQ